MRSTRVILFLATFLALLGSIWLFGRKRGFTPTMVSGALSQEIYIWQRQWTEPTKAAVAEFGSLTSGFLPLTGQLTWEAGGQAKLVAVNVDWDALTASGAKFGVVLRVDPLASKFIGQPAVHAAVVNAAKTLLEKASKHGQPKELQLDFDAAESQLLPKRARERRPTSGRHGGPPPGWPERRDWKFSARNLVQIKLTWPASTNSEKNPSLT